MEVEPPTYHADAIAEEHHINEDNLSPTLGMDQGRQKKKRRSSAFIQIHGTIDECQIISNTQLSLSPYKTSRKSSLDKDFVSTISVQVSAPSLFPISRVKLEVDPIVTPTAVKSFVLLFPSSQVALYRHNLFKRIPECSERCDVTKH